MSTEHFLNILALKSEGDFLWAYLAVDALLQNAGHASWKEVRELLEQLPSGMMPLYSQILARRAGNTNSVTAEAATYFRWCLEHMTANRHHNQDPLLLRQALLIWELLSRNEKQYWLEVDEQTYRKDYMRLDERIQDLAVGLLRPTYGGELKSYPYVATNGGFLYEYNNDPRHEPNSRVADAGNRFPCEPTAAHELVAVKFELFHRTVTDLFTDAPEGRKFMDRCSLSPSQLLLSRIDAEMLRCRLWHRDSSLHRVQASKGVIVRLIRYISQFRQYLSTPGSDMQVLEAIQRVKDAVMTISAMNQEQASGQPTDPAYCVVYDLPLPLDVAVLWDLASHVTGYDVEGLLLEFGNDVWYMEKQVQHLDTGLATSPVMTAGYKHYLLLCATKGNLPLVARGLVENGGDFTPTITCHSVIPRNVQQRESC